CFAYLVDGLEVRTEDLDADLRAHAGREHVDTVGDRLSPYVAPARHLHHRIDLLQQVSLRTGLPPPQEERLRKRCFQLLSQSDEGHQGLRVMVLAVASPMRLLGEAGVLGPVR